MGEVLYFLVKSTLRKVPLDKTDKDQYPWTEMITPGIRDAVNASDTSNKQLQLEI